MIDQKRIDDYWNWRSEDFNQLRLDDYHSVMKQNYSDIFAAYLGDVSGKRGLDLGTGAGFFALILAESGAGMTGIDASAQMLENAAKNSRTLGYPAIEYRQMDAHALEYADGEFDFVVTRNVTWTLRDPQQAYREIVRVLKPGGKVLNFDANYGRSFRRAEERGEPLRHPTQTQEMLRERNEIAKSLYICEKNRPYWDMQILHELGLSRFSLDLDIDRWVCRGSSREQVYKGIPKKDLDTFFLLMGEK